MIRVNHVSIKWWIGIIIACTIALGFIVRVYNIDKNPAGFFTDEASIGFNAYHLLHFGTDEYNIRLPIFFRSFGDYRPPIPFYGAIPFVAFFGLNEMSVRLATVFIGTLTIPLMFFFVYLLLQHIEIKKYSIISSIAASIVLSISPWHIHFSRFGSEYIYLPFFVLLALSTLSIGFDKPVFLPLAAILLSLVSYTYLPGIVIGPLCAILICIIFYKTFSHHIAWSIIALIVYLICMIPIILATTNGTLLTRWNNVGLSHLPNTRNQLQTFATQYIEHFSPIFLFTKGDIDYPGHFIRRFSVKGIGELYNIEAIFIMIGAWALAVHIRKRKTIAVIPFILLALYPIGSSITTTDGGGPLAFRSVLGSVVFPIFTGIGIAAIAKTLHSRKKMAIYLLTLCILFTGLFGRYLYLYHVQYPLYSQDFWGWQFGPRNIMQYFLSQKNNFDQLVIVGDFNSPEMFIRFYDPRNICQSKCLIGDPMVLDTSKRQLFAIEANKASQFFPHQFRIQKTIYYPNATEAFYIGTFYQ